MQSTPEMLLEMICSVQEEDEHLSRKISELRAEVQSLDQRIEEGQTQYSLTETRLEALDKDIAEAEKEYQQERVGFLGAHQVCMEVQKKLQEDEEALLLEYREAILSLSLSFPSSSSSSCLSHASEIPLSDSPLPEALLDTFFSKSRRERLKEKMGVITWKSWAEESGVKNDHELLFPIKGVDKEKGNAHYYQDEEDEEDILPAKKVDLIQYLYATLHRNSCSPLALPHTCLSLDAAMAMVGRIKREVGKKEKEEEEEAEKEEGQLCTQGGGFSCLSTSIFAQKNDASTENTSTDEFQFSAPVQHPSLLSLAPPRLKGNSTCTELEKEAGLEEGQASTTSSFSAAFPSKGWITQPMLSSERNMENEESPAARTTSGGGDHEEEETPAGLFTEAREEGGEQKSMTSPLKASSLSTSPIMRPSKTIITTTFSSPPASRSSRLPIPFRPSSTCQTKRTKMIIKRSQEGEEEKHCPESVPSYPCSNFVREGRESQSPLSPSHSSTHYHHHHQEKEEMKQEREPKHSSIPLFEDPWLDKLSVTSVFPWEEQQQQQEPNKQEEGCSWGGRTKHRDIEGYASSSSSAFAPPSLSPIAVVPGLTPSLSRLSQKRGRGVEEDTPADVLSHTTNNNDKSPFLHVRAKTISFAASPELEIIRCVKGKNQNRIAEYPTPWSSSSESTVAASSSSCCSATSTSGGSESAYGVTPARPPCSSFVPTNCLPITHNNTNSNTVSSRRTRRTMLCPGVRVGAALFTPSSSTASTLSKAAEGCTGSSGGTPSPPWSGANTSTGRIIKDSRTTSSSDRPFPPHGTPESSTRNNSDNKNKGPAVTSSLSVNPPSQSSVPIILSPLHPHFPSSSSSSSLSDLPLQQKNISNHSPLLHEDKSTSRCRSRKQNAANHPCSSTNTRKYHSGLQLLDEVNMDYLSCVSEKSSCVTDGSHAPSSSSSPSVSASTLIPIHSNNKSDEQVEVHRCEIGGGNSVFLSYVCREGGGGGHDVCCDPPGAVSEMLTCLGEQRRSAQVASHTPLLVQSHPCNHHLYSPSNFSLGNPRHRFCCSSVQCSPSTVLDRESNEALVRPILEQGNFLEEDHHHHPPNSPPSSADIIGNEDNNNNNDGGGGGRTSPVLSGVSPITVALYGRLFGRGESKKRTRAL